MPPQPHTSAHPDLRTASLGLRLHRPGSLLVALACAVSGVWLAWHHPLLGALAPALWFILAAAAFRHPDAWPAVLVALLPVCGLATWTGWLLVEELDLLVLAAAAGGWVHLALQPRAQPRARPAAPQGGVLIVVLALLVYAGLKAYSMHRGVMDAGGWQFGWWHGYHEPMNSVRMAKALPLALLLIPLWRTAFDADPQRLSHRLGQGMLAGLALVSVLALWERLAFPGLLNFSTDYRTTAGFWEMHVGGAALDAFLALTMPFGVMAMVRATSTARWLTAAAVVLLGAYACLTTFSRILFVAVPAGLLVMAMLEVLRRRGAGKATAVAQSPQTVLAALLWLAGFGLAAAWMFGTSGWRGMLALWGVVALAVPLLMILPSLSRLGWAWAAGLALAQVSVVAAAYGLLEKGAYIAYVVAWAGCSVALWRLSAVRDSGTGGELVAAASSAGDLPGALALSSWLAAVAGLLAVALHWGETPALHQAAPVAALLVLVVLAVLAWRRPSLAPAGGPRAAGSLLAAMLVMGSVIGGFGGGDYISQRLSTGERDVDYRLGHWQRALSWLDGPLDPAFGKGLGRYPSRHLLDGAATDSPGDYRLVGLGDEKHLVLTGGKHEIDWGQVLRISQRVAGPGGSATVKVRARADRPVGLHLEVCEKNLLYHGACMFTNVEVKPDAAGWTTFTLPMSGGPVTGGSAWLPRPVVFSFGLLSRGGRLEVDDLELLDAAGRSILHNGSFGEGMARWYFTSDHHHMPWHLKSLPVHVLFDQGWVGGALLAALTLAAFWRVGFGAARHHALSPVLAGSVTAFLVVGLIDSLLDMPRLTWMFYLLLLVMLLLPPRRPGGAA